MGVKSRVMIFKVTVYILFLINDTKWHFEMGCVQIESVDKLRWARQNSHSCKCLTAAGLAGFRPHSNAEKDNCCSYQLLGKRMARALAG